MLALPPLSALLPSFVAMGAAFLPPIAAAGAGRRFLREPAGQVALCWLVAALGGLGETVLVLLTHPAADALGPLVMTSGVTLVIPLLLLPPTLTWIGRAAKRRQSLLLAAWVVAWCVAVVATGGARQFKATVDPLVSGGMAFLSAWALAAQVRRAPRSLAREDWSWILVGHVMYFAVDMLRMPLIETLVAHHWAAAIEVHNGIMLLYSASYVLIARGMLLRAPAAGPVPAFAASATQAA